MAAAPLAVDLDGTLIHGDVSVMAGRAWAVADPWAFVRAAPLLAFRRAAFKARLAHAQPAPRATMRAYFLVWLQAQRAAGRRLHLITGADQAHAEAIATPLGLFDGIEGSDGRTNLVGRAKARRLMQLFPDGFSYAGDSAKDLPVFACARSIVLVGARASVRRAAQRLGAPIEAEFA
jgi:phosphoserine phosphatase